MQKIKKNWEGNSRSDDNSQVKKNLKMTMKNNSYKFIQ